MLVGRKVAFGLPALSLACLLLLLGVCARSAQVPLHGWLHETARAPAGAFVLLSTAGMLTAGVYLIARLGFLFALSPVASGAVALVGVATATWGAMGSALQYDLRRVISYGAMSQLGVALVAFGTHAFWVGVLELVVSAVVVACLASCAGTLARALRTSEPDASAAHDLRKLGGLARRLPRTARTFQVACLAFTMAPVPLLAGFWPTTLVLQETFTTGRLPGVLAKVIGAVLLASIGLVGFAMWRAYYLTFLGAPQPGRAAASKGKDAPEERHGLSWLGVACAVTGAALGMSSRLVGGPGGAALESWLDPVFSTATSPPPPVSGAVALGLAALVLVAACCGWVLARGRYGSGRSGGWADEEAKSPLFAWGARFR